MNILSYNTSSTYDRYKNESVAIIGGGATSVAFLYNYLQMIESGNDLPQTLYIFESRDQFGPGAAYDSDLQSNLLNTKAGTITPFHDRPGDFYNWLATNGSSWQARYSSLELDEHSYAPRHLFGEYLESQMNRLIGEAVDRGVTVIQINAEVSDVFPSGHRYVVMTDRHSIRCNFVFFLCGGVSKALRRDEQESRRVLSSPYPVSKLANVIPKTASVGIIGARLSCIDAVIGLIEQGHRGSVSIHSRSGYFPSVRGTQGRIKPKILTAERLADMVLVREKLTLLDLVGMVCEEVALQGGSEAKGDFYLPPPPRDLAAFLRDEIANAAGERVWQAVLYSTNAIIDRLWMSLHEEDRARFMDRYFSAFMAYRVSIPVGNARKILSYLESGQVKFHPGTFDVGFERNGRPVVTMGDQSSTAVSYDYVVNATGSARAVTATDSLLVNNLLRRGIISPHKFGGIAVDKDSYRVIGADGAVNPYLRAVGELTVGTFFFTSALEINARHARSCAIQFAASLEKSRLAVAA